MLKKRFDSGGITIALGGNSSDGVFGEKANSGNPYPFPNSNAGDSPTTITQYSEGAQRNQLPQQNPQNQQNQQNQQGLQGLQNPQNNPAVKMFKRGGSVKSLSKSSFKPSSASKRGDGIAQRGKTRGKYC